MTTKFESFDAQLLAKKRSWNPATLSPNQVVMPGSEGTIGRALALRKLEVPVGNWISEVTAREKEVLTLDAMTLLKSNIEDENQHDVALEYAHQAYNLTTETMQKEADQLIERWMELGKKTHPIVLAGSLECSVFFVILPIFRFLGGSGLRTTANDISNDEILHVAANQYWAKQLGYIWDEKLNQLREDTVQWVVQDLDAVGKWGSKQTWLKSSRSLLENGKAPEFKETKNFVYTAFFEQDNRNIPIYGY